MLRKKDWLVQSLPFHNEAVSFLRATHYARGAPNTSTYRHGLYRDDPATSPLVGELMGVALWIPPTRAAAETVDSRWQGVLALSRFAIAPDVPTNAASFLLGASMRLVDRHRWPTLLTYADTGQGHTGAIYLATNWTCLGEVAAGDTWLAPDGTQMGRKRGGYTYRAEEMLAAGFVRSDPAVKLKFVHRLPSRPKAVSCAGVSHKRALMGLT